MPNRNLFRSSPSVAPTTTRNAAGGRAYAMSDSHALAQYAVTGTLNDTCYIKAETQLANLLELAKKCNPEYVAKTAIYARQNGLMKDTPVLLLAYLMTLDNKQWFNATFPYVLTNIGSLRAFAQIVRSGALGRKSLGSAGKRAINSVLTSMDAGRIFWQASSGTASVNTVDLLRLAHPRPMDSQHDALYAYLLGRPYDFEALPTNVQDFENFKAGRTQVVPKVDFRRLSNLNLNTSQWRELAENMTWNQLRLNLRNLSRHQVFEDSDFIRVIARRLVNPDAIARSGALPFALHSTYLSTMSDPAIPQPIRNAVSAAVDLSVVNAPELPGRTLIMVDSSGSMRSDVTGYSPFRPTQRPAQISCVQAAGYFAAGIVKANPEQVVDVFAYDTRIQRVNLNPRDSVTTMVKSFPTQGGGTNTGGCLAAALATGIQPDNIIIVSDNMSWVDYATGYGATATMTAQVFERYRRSNSQATIVCWDIQPGLTSQINETNRGKQLNIGGFSDSVFKIVGKFLNDDTDFVSTINNINLD